MASTNDLANEIMSQVKDALNPITGPYFDMQTERANMTAAALGMQSSSSMIKTESDLVTTDIQNIFTAIETKINELTTRFEQSSTDIANRLNTLEPEKATSIDPAKLQQSIDVKAYIPTAEELKIALDPIPTGADRGIANVSGDIINKINAVARPTAAKGMEQYGLDKDFVPQSEENAARFAAELFTVLAEIINSNPRQPDYYSINQVDQVDLDQYLPDFSLISGKYETILSDLTNIGDGPKALDYAIESFEYTFTSVWSTLTTVLSRNIQGGTGLDPAAEQALWARHRQRIAKQIDQDVRRVTMALAGRGFSMPPGRLNSAVQAVVAKYSEESIDTSRDIAGKQADLMQTNMHHAIESALRFEELNSGIFIKNKQMEMDYQRFLLGVAVDLYKLHLDTIKSKAEILIAVGRIYELEMKNMELHLEQFKAKLEQEKSKADMNRTLVEQYKTEMEALATRISGYRTIGDTIKVMLEVDQLGAQVFTTKAQAYSAYIGAIRSDYERYTTDIKAATVESDIQEILTKAYTAEINGIDVRNSAEIKRIGAVVDRFTQIVGASGHEIAAGNLEIDRFSKTQSAYSELYKLDVEKELTQLDTILKSYNVGMEGTKAKVDVLKDKVDILKFKLESFSSMLMKGEQNEIDSYGKGVDAIGKTLGSAYSSIHAVGVNFQKLT